jgi:hypothetical protein
MGMRQTVVRVAAAVFLCPALGFPSWAAAAEADEIAELKRAIEALKAENRELARRLGALEAEKAEREKAAQAEPAKEKPEAVSPPVTIESAEREQLEQRVKELEMERAAQEEAVRSIIRDSMAKTGSRINEFVSLGGVLEVVAGRSEDFSGESKGEITLGAAQLDLEIQVNEWTLGSVIVEYVDGTDVIFPTTAGFESGVDRINLDTASITIGDPLRFPPYLTAGRLIVPFGISTGNPVTDVLTMEDPLTIEVFEMRRNAVGLGVGFPTPPLAPAPPPVVAPAPRPLVINPLVDSLSRRMGYAPPPRRPKPHPLFTLTPALPPYNAGVYFFQGETGGPTEHINATAGYRTKGRCGLRYERLLGIALCPWGVDVSVDYTSSIFDSRFLSDEYEAFLDQIGLVPAMAASVKSTIGPVSFVAEWNGAIESATFSDDLGNAVGIKPAAWEISLGYQFDWHPWVEEIGAHGTYVALGYSQSSDLAGVTQLVSGVPTRVGFVPRRRLLLTAAEWVLDGLRLAIEYSYNWDYSTSEGGTGNSANGLFTTLTYTW